MYLIPHTSTISGSNNFTTQAELLKLTSDRINLYEINSWMRLRLFQTFPSSFQSKLNDSMIVRKMTSVQLHWCFITLWYYSYNYWIFLFLNYVITGCRIFNFNVTGYYWSIRTEYLQATLQKLTVRRFLHFRVT